MNRKNRDKLELVDEPEVTQNRHRASFRNGVKMFSFAGKDF